MRFENAILIVNKTRLESLIERFNTKAQAKFYIEHAGGSFKDYELEHENFKKSLEIVQNKVSKWMNCKIVDRQYLSNYVFAETDLLLVLGQDGLVANTAKYAKEQPIIAINPDTERYDGILLPYNTSNFENAIANTVECNAQFKSVTMAKVELADGQKLLAFNDFFIGPSSHISARYQLSYNGKIERQSSSGIIVSTGAGSTGWLSSLFNMANGLYQSFGSSSNQINYSMDWDSKKLVFVVREPFKSIYNDASLLAGVITNENELAVESFMPSYGKIFSDGIESDYLDFNSGAIAKIGLANEKANIVIS